MSLRVLLLQTEVEADRGGVHQVAARREHEKEKLVSRGRNPMHSFWRALPLLSGVPLTGNKLALARRSVLPKCCVGLLAAHLKFEPPLPTLLLSPSLSLSIFR